jgi:hypothetical protein
VKGPIAREYQSGASRKAIRSATLEPGYRFHLHRRSEPRPLELDPFGFDFEDQGDAGSSSLLRLTEWTRALAAPADDGFRRLPPALAPADKERVNAALRRGRAEDRAVVLDNLAQFRAYSAWRGVLARRASAATAY